MISSPPSTLRAYRAPRSCKTWPRYSASARRMSPPKTRASESPPACPGGQRPPPRRRLLKSSRPRRPRTSLSSPFPLSPTPLPRALVRDRPQTQARRGQGRAPGRRKVRVGRGAWGWALVVGAGPSRLRSASLTTCQSRTRASEFSRCDRAVGALAWPWDGSGRVGANVTSESKGIKGCG